MPLVSLTLATLRSAEFGFLGVVVKTCVHTPRRWGAPLRAGVLVFDCLVARPLRTSCSMVGTCDLLGGVELGASGVAGARRAVTRTPDARSYLAGAATGRAGEGGGRRPGGARAASGPGVRPRRQA